MRRWFLAFVPLVLLAFIVQLPGGVAKGDPRATLSPDEAATLAPTLTAQALTQTALALTQTADTQATQTAVVAAAPTLTPTCAPGPLCTYLTSIERQPPPTATPLPPTAPPAPAVRVLSSRSFVDGSTLHVAGEVRNDTSTTVDFVRIDARYYDVANVLIDTDFTYAYLDELAPGQKSPFKVFSFNPPAGIVRTELGVDWNVPRTPDNRMVTVLSATVRTVSGNTEVVGEVRNDSGVALQFVQVVATFYASDGSVFDVDFTYATPDDLAPGQTASYKISTFDDLSGTSVVVQSEGDMP